MRWKLVHQPSKEGILQPYMSGLRFHFINVWSVTKFQFRSIASYIYIQHLLCRRLSQTGLCYWFLLPHIVCGMFSCSWIWFSLWYSEYIMVFFISLACWLSASHSSTYGCFTLVYIPYWALSAFISSMWMVLNEAYLWDFLHATLCIS